MIVSLTKQRQKKKNFEQSASKYICGSVMQSGKGGKNGLDIMNGDQEHQL